MIGQDDPDDLLSWIQERITCQIPNKESDPELYNLVTRYQMHKCSAYCKRKCGNVFITRCRFGFPRQPCETAKLNYVSDSLKTRNRIYQLARSESATRVNDYNPLLLMLWKADIDIQFVTESSLALAHYVSGYVTKAERSSMQETVVRHAVLQQYNDCRYRKSIRGCIPMYIFAAVYFLYFLQALFVSDFTYRSPNKDKQVEQPFHCRLVQVL